MRNQPETVHEYNISRLNWIFALSSLVFLGCIVWMVYDDWATKKPWKKYQREFQAIEAKKLADDIKLAQKRAEELGLKEIEEQLAAQKTALEKQTTEENRLQKSLDAARVAFELADRNYKFEKASLDERKYKYDHAYETVKHEHPDWTPEQIRADKHVAHEAAAKKNVEDKVETLRLAAQEAETKQKEAQTALDKIIGEKKMLEKTREALLTDKGLAERRFSILTDPVVQTVLNAPIVEFARPQLAFDQKIIETYRFDVNFAQAPRVDRCMTCHVAADKRSAFSTVALKEKRPVPFNQDQVGELINSARGKGSVTYEDIAKFVENLGIKGITNEEWSQLTGALKEARVEMKDFYAQLHQPFTNHPRLDLFVASDSPHPVEKFGCTICHWGWDRETDFVRANHAPNDAKQKEEWKGKYHWHPTGFFEQPMRTQRFLEASCLKCHTNVTEVPQAEKLNLGRALIETAACYSCHVINQLETKVAHKIDATQAVPAETAFDTKLSLDRKRELMNESLDKIAKLYGVSADSIRASNILSKPSDLTAGRMLNIPVRTLGKRAPALDKIASKTDENWMREWLASPRSVRPNTWMPHFWGLENNQKLGDTLTGPERDALEINAITSYIFAISEKPTYPAPPKGDAAKGKNLVNNLGCLACHIVGETYDELRAVKLAKLKEASKSEPQIQTEMTRFERDLLSRSQGPSLFGSGSKLKDAGWTFAWLKDPKQHSPDSSMPNMRLSDQEAADITAFLLTLQGAPQKPLPQTSGTALDVLTVEYLENQMTRKNAEEQAKNMRVAVTKDMRAPAAEALGVGYTDAEIEVELRKALKPEEFEAMMVSENVKREAFAAQREKLGEAKIAANKALQSDAVLKNIYLGRQLVARYGCFGCHDIKGFEKGKPIGPELYEWGSKSVLKLDYGYQPPNKVARTNIAFLHQKLAAPRSLDKTDTKKPQEYLRMPQFAFNETQIEAISTHILGQTNEKIAPHGLAKLTSAQEDIEKGRWLAKELNCIGCHVFEGKGVNPADPHYGKGGAIRDTLEDATFWPPILYGEGAKVQPQWLFKFLKQPYEIRPAFFEAGQHARMPNFNLTDEQVNIFIRYFAAADNQSFPFERDTVGGLQPHADAVAAGEKTFNAFKCVSCHNIVPGRPVGPAQIVVSGPNLGEAKTRLKPAWVESWLRNPAAWQPGSKMPAFWGDDVPDRDAQIRAVRDYLLTYPGPKESELAKPPDPNAKPAESYE